MLVYNLICIFAFFSIVIAYLNYKYIKIQSSIAILSASLLCSLGLILLHHLGFEEFFYEAQTMVKHLNFQEFLLNGILSFLLFAGSLTLDFGELRKNKWEIGVLSSFSTLASTALIGICLFYLADCLNHPLPMIYCFLFGALISPTDPIAVLAIIKQLHAPKDLETTIAGESLFNDGVGIVIFLTLFQMTFHGQAFSWQQTLILFLRQAVGGITFGIILGFVAYTLIRSIEDHKLQILITLLIPTAGYSLAQALEISGPLAMVVSGIFIANKAGQFYMLKTTREYLDVFWEIIDEVLNALLFFLIGLEILTLNFSGLSPTLMLIAIPLVLVSRFVTVALPLHLFKIRRQYEPFMISILTWGGLRGGLAIAMALLLPPSNYRDTILTMTYAVVLFTILVQGTSCKQLIGWSLKTTR